MRSRSASSTDDRVVVGPAVEIGRFAPSPTGPLHLGSLLTAVASFVHAHAHGGRWLLRIEDLDTPRCVEGATDSILRTLDAHGLWWDELAYQHQRLPLYRRALERLVADGRTFACTCSRSQLQDCDVYPGTCRNTSAPPDRNLCSIRLRVPSETLGFVDGIQGPYAQRLDTDVGDFVVFRRDGIFAYQLAVVVDDGEQHVTDVLRGADLLDNTPRQLLLYRWLDLPTPRFLHVPVLTDRSGAKLSKHSAATDLGHREPAENLLVVLDLLGQPPPRTLRGAQPHEILAWAIAEWNVDAIPRGIAHPDFVCV